MSECSFSFPPAVSKAFALDKAAASRELSGGLINKTFLINNGDITFILQRLSPIFAAQVMADIEAVTRHLEASGLTTPKLIKTTAGALFVTDDAGFIWRALTYIAGQTFTTTQSAAQAESAGALLGYYHHILQNFTYNFKHIRAHVHESKWHFNELARAAKEASPAFEGLKELRELAANILANSAALLDFTNFPTGVVHGDPKIANFLFRGEKALTMVDLDTFARRALITELADALRSFAAPMEEWANPAFNMTYWQAFLAGYRRNNGQALAQMEPYLPQAVRTISLELSARFAKEAFIPQNFAWDNNNFASAHAHNLARATSQFNLALSVAI